MGVYTIGRYSRRFWERTAKKQSLLVSFSVMRAWYFSNGLPRRSIHSFALSASRFSATRLDGSKPSSRKAFRTDFSVAAPLAMQCTFS